MRERPEHLLAVEVTCAPPADRTAKRNITGVFQHWDCLDPDWNPGGIWRPVRIDETGPVRISRLRTLCREATDERAVVGFRAVLDAADATTVDAAHDDRRHRPRGRAPARRRRRTRSSGPSPSSDPRCGGRTPSARSRSATWPSRCAPTRRRATSDRPSERPATAFRTGLRQVQMKRWVLSVNGERLFLKGVEPGPDAHGARRGHAGRAGGRRRAGQGGGPRPAARPRPRDPARALRRRRRGGPAAVAGHAAAVGLRPGHPQAGRPPGARGRRPARPPPVDRRVVRPQRAAHPRPRARASASGRARCAVDGAADVEQDRARPLGEPGPRDGRPHPAGRSPTRACGPASARAAPTPPLLRLVPRRRARPAPVPARPGPGSPGSCPSSAPRPCPRATSSWSPTGGPTSTGTGSRRTTRCRSRSSTATCPPPTSPTFDAWRQATQATRPP